MQRAGKTLESYYAADNRKDIATARRHLHPDLIFYALFETYRNAEEYLTALTGLLSITKRLDVKAIVAQDEDAAIFFDLETTAPAQATTFVGEWHKMRGGKIVKVRSAFDGRPFEAMFAAKN